MMSTMSFMRQAWHALSSKHLKNIASMTTTICTLVCVYNIYVYIYIVYNITYVCIEQYSMIAFYASKTSE